jgi:hypothetical protein
MTHTQQAPSNTASPDTVAAWRKANERLRHLRVRCVTDATGLARREYPIALAEVKRAYAAMTGLATAAPAI